ncbi:MAG TPA: HAD-IC family P-type ATPase [Acidimicrobiales bacterium]|nr:HAD-IC family P-type ATPase [Acidimicrobiales bacterium]
MVGAASRSASRRPVTDQRRNADRDRDERLGPDDGLTAGEAAARLERYGPNRLAEHERGALAQAIGHLWNPIQWMIEAALVLTGVTDRWADFGMIAALLGPAALAERQGTDLMAVVEGADGFAQVVPEDKYRIVAALQAGGHIVGMTGDGVNDAPALHRADAGIAVAGATDAARAAADIVLLAPGLSVIIDAIHRAREVFRRMVNYAIYRITETIRVVGFVTVSIVAFGFFPVSPVQIVLLAILNDAAILTIAYDRVVPSRRPERWDLTEVLAVATVLGLAGVVSSFGVLSIGHTVLHLSDDEVRTLLYLKLSVAGHLTLFVARTRGRFWSQRPATVLLVAVVGTQLIATCIAWSGAFMTPLRWNLVGLAWGYALAWMLVLDELKLRVYTSLDRRAESRRVET